MKKKTRLLLSIIIASIFSLMVKLKITLFQIFKEIS